VIDGPLAEATEVVGGFGQGEFKSKEEAVEAAVRFMELHKKHWPGWEGETRSSPGVRAGRFSCAMIEIPDMSP